MYSRVCISNEPENGEILNSSILKNVSGNDEIVIRGLYQTSFTKFYTQSKVCILTNFRPKFNSEDEAIYSRICIIPYYNKFSITDPEVVERRNKMLEVDKDGKIQNETKFRPEFIKSLFKFLVIGAMKSNVLYRDYEEPEECKELREKYKKENDVFVNWMNDNYEKITETEFRRLDKQILRSDLLSLYKYYCSRNDIEFNKNIISKRITEEYGVKKSNGYFYVLVKEITNEINENNDEEKKE
jgi:phage/plasmid-associated DNA primase